MSESFFSNLFYTFTIVVIDTFNILIGKKELDKVFKVGDSAFPDGLV